MIYLLSAFRHPKVTEWVARSHVEHKLRARACAREGRAGVHTDKNRAKTNRVRLPVRQTEKALISHFALFCLKGDILRNWRTDRHLVTSTGSVASPSAGHTNTPTHTHTDKHRQTRTEGHYLPLSGAGLMLNQNTQKLSKPQSKPAMSAIMSTSNIFFSFLQRQPTI